MDTLANPSSRSPSSNLEESQNADSHISSDLDYDSEDAIAHDAIALKLSRLEMNSDEPRFFGKSSILMLFKTALDHKQDYISEGADNPGMGPKYAFREKFWKEGKVCISFLSQVFGDLKSNGSGTITAFQKTTSLQCSHLQIYWPHSWTTTSFTQTLSFPSCTAQALNSV